MIGQIKRTLPGRVVRLTSRFLQQGICRQKIFIFYIGLPDTNECIVVKELLKNAQMCGFISKVIN
jgi:hypothetical protein